MPVAKQTGNHRELMVICSDQATTPIPSKQHYVTYLCACVCVRGFPKQEQAEDGEKPGGLVMFKPR